jgi:FAD linked oxidases, C-terminal domain
MEWGGKAYDLMWRLKSLFDPDDVLNPGVVLNKVLPDLYNDKSSAAFLMIPGSCLHI